MTADAELDKLYNELKNLKSDHDRPEKQELDSKFILNLVDNPPQNTDMTLGEYIGVANSSNESVSEIEQSLMFLGDKRKEEQMDKKEQKKSRFISKAEKPRNLFSSVRKQIKYSDELITKNYGKFKSKLVPEDEMSPLKLEQFKTK